MGRMPKAYVEVPGGSQLSSVQNPKCRSIVLLGYEQDS